MGSSKIFKKVGLQRDTNMERSNFLGMEFSHFRFVRERASCGASRGPRRPGLKNLREPIQFNDQFILENQLYSKGLRQHGLEPAIAVGVVFKTECGLGPRGQWPFSMF